MPIWNRSNNFILTAADKSYLGAKSIFEAFDIKLKVGKADPDIQLYYTSFHPYCLGVDDGYAVWNTLRSGGAGKTLGVVQLLDQLSGVKIKAWDIAIQAVYDNTTPQYKTLLPHHRSPFQKGTANSRAVAVNTLINQIDTDASLAVVKTNIVAFLALLSAEMIVQKNQIPSIDNAITVLDNAVTAASEEAFRIYGCFVTKFYKTPKSMEVFFPIDLLQNVSQSSFVATLVNKTPKKLFKRKINLTKQIFRYTNIGEDVVNAYFTNGLTDVHTAGTPIKAMQPNTMEICSATEMGYTDANRHLHIVNTGSGTAGVEIEILIAN